MTNKKLSQITNQIVQNYQPEQIVLFGSMAKDEKAANDIDLFLIKKTGQKRHIDRVRKVRKFLPDDIPIDLVIYTPQEYKKALEEGSYFVEEILSKSKVLYEEKK